MIGESVERIAPREMRVRIDDKEIRLHVVDRSDQAEIIVQVDDDTNQDQIADAAKTALQQRYWFVNHKWEQEMLRERFKIELGAHAVEVFAFGEGLRERVRAEIIRTLERFYNKLSDKSLWCLESIQILPQQTINPKNGEPLRGMESPAQRRLELYPAGMTDSAYRNGELPCTELEGTLAHEITHVVLEDTLAGAWWSEDLGWETHDEVWIELPGGSRTTHFNKRSQECPTSYGGLKPDDDRADSVVAYLFAPDQLNKNRKRILDRVLAGNGDEITAKATPLDAALPQVPSDISVYVSQNHKNLFGVSSIRPGKERRIVTLSDFRKEHNIPEPKF